MLYSTFLIAFLLSSDAGLRDSLESAIPTPRAARNAPVSRVAADAPSCAISTSPAATRGPDETIAPALVYVFKVIL